MREFRAMPILLIGLLLSLPTWHWASADVAPGDVIDKSNWQKAEGLLPAPVLNWVKKGDFVLNVNELNYNPAEFVPPDVLKSLESNVGKYDLDEDDGIIDVKTGKLPDFIQGLPFPKIDPNDPKLGQKLMYNKNYNVYSHGNLRLPARTVWVGQGGYEREIEFEYMQAPLDGYSPTKAMRNPDSIERYNIIVVTKPYDVAGTAVMLWRYRGPRQDMNFSYLPTIRRVRRMSPANRSDAFVGSDGSVDDVGGYDGKISAFEWEVIKEQEALFPFLGSDPQRLKQNEMDEWVTTPAITGIVYGYEKEGWQGSPWCPTSVVWAKRPAWVIRMTPKDRYYNYGVQDLWVDKETFWPYYKQIDDRAGEYWKFLLIATSALETADNKIRATVNALVQAVDERSQHSSYSEGATPELSWALFADLNLRDFTLAGFQKYCK